MSTLTAEKVLRLVAELPPGEQARFKQLVEQWQPATDEPPSSVAATNGTATRPQPQPVPDGKREMQWLADHQRKYIGQWVALDGDRLIAANPDHDAVWVAAEADGAYLPLITRIEDPDHPIHFFWT